MKEAKQKALVAWSSGKDSALALHEVARSGRYEIVSLLTTVTEDYARVSMHGVRRELLRRQAASLGYPLEEVSISKGATDEDYESAMRRTLEKFRDLGVACVIFGDIFLEDLRDRRQSRLAEVGMRAAFPLWKKDTAALARRVIDLGFKAVVTCVDSEALDGRFAGRCFDEALLAELPPGVDPCGENGEFHSFVHDGPIFREPVRCRTGRVVLREGRFYFCDVVPDA
jgi:uncharacterized protein (TIGR00290 family)